MASTGTPDWGDDSLVSSFFDVPDDIHTVDRKATPVHIPQVRQAAMLVEQSGIPTELARYRREDGYDPNKGGRPSIFSDRQILTLLMLLQLEGSPLHITRARDLLRYRLTDAALMELGVSPSDLSGGDGLVYARVYGAYRRVLAPLDPFPNQQRRRRYKKKKWAKVYERRDQALELSRNGRLHHVMNLLVWSSVLSAPPRVRESWDGSICMDGTSFKATKKGSSSRSKRMSSEPNAGWYRRDDDHLGLEGKKALFWAYEATTITMGAPGPDDSFVRLLVGVSINRPGVQPAQQAFKAMENLIANDVPVNFLAGDKLYMPGQKPENFQIPMRQLGYRLLGDIRKGETGIQGSHDGAILVDGNWYCPGMPEDLITIEADLVAGTIDEKIRAKRIRRRASFLLREKEAPRPDGSIRYKPPCLGPGVTCVCPLRELGACPPVNGKPRARVLIPPAEPRGICTKSTISIPIHAGAKYAQQGEQFGTDAWHTQYNHLRETVESRNKYLKDSSGGQLDDRSRRLIRGFAAQGLVLAITVAADNIRATKAFLTRPAAKPAKQATPAPRRVRESRWAKRAKMLAANPPNAPGQAA